jgi:hypothetical protein
MLRERPGPRARACDGVAPDALTSASCSASSYTMRSPPKRTSHSRSPLAGRLPTCARVRRLCS